MDPLKPFSSSIRALWESGAKRVDRTERATSTNSAGTPQMAEPVSPAPPPQPLHARLRTRLASLPTWDALRARELFVESVILSELGETLAADPAFTSLIQRVSNQLGTDTVLSARLDQLLKNTCNGEHLAN
jgi:hypothetical protein